MSFRIEKTKDYFLLDTKVENMFINEYMAPAPEGYVKVYLFALMYAELGVEFSNEDISKQLSMDIEDVLKAWTYWEKMGIVRKINRREANSLEYDIEFVLLKDMLYGNHDEAESAAVEQGMGSQMGSAEYREMFSRIEKTLGRVISGSEMSEIVSWINDFDTDTEVVAFAFEYCAQRKKKTIKYVGAVIRNWISEGCRTMDEIAEHIGQIETRDENHRRVFQALGFRRNPTEEEKRLMDRWFAELGFGIETVLQACSKTSGISSPNINYVNRILENWHEAGGAKAANAGEVTTGQIVRYYELLRQKEEREAEDRKKEVYDRIPRIREIDKEEKELGSKLSRIVVSNQIDKKEATEKIRETIESLSAERAFLLTDNGFELDYMEIKYQCPKCKDTGMLETGEKCQCFGEITAEKIALMSKTE